MMQSPFYVKAMLLAWLLSIAYMFVLTLEHSQKYSVIDNQYNTTLEQEV